MLLLFSIISNGFYVQIRQVKHQITGAVAQRCYIKKFFWNVLQENNWDGVSSIKGAVPQFLENFQSSHSVEHMWVAASEINARNLFKVTNKNVHKTSFDVVMSYASLIQNRLTLSINLFARKLNFLILALAKSCTLS